MSLKKSILLALLVVLISVPTLWYTVVIPYNTSQAFFKQAPTYFETIINETYPHDLEVQITNGVVSLNRPTPYCLTLDKESYQGILFDPNFNVDMYRPEILSSYPLCTPIVVVGESTVIYPDNSELGYTVSEIDPSVNVTINKSFVDSLTQSMVPILIEWGWWLYLLAPLFLIPLIFIIVLIANIWYAMINKIIFSLMDMSDYSPFSKSYALSLRFLTIIIIVCSVTWGYSFYSQQELAVYFPFLNTIIIATLSVIWAKKFSSNYTLSGATTEQKMQVESQAVPSPQPQKSMSLSDSAKSNTGYTFDPSVISPPVEKPINKDL